MAKAPRQNTDYEENAVCPECGDEAFFVDCAEDGKPDDFGFSCDSCDYIIFLSGGEHRDELIALAKRMVMR